VFIIAEKSARGSVAALTPVPPAAIMEAVMAVSGDSSSATRPAPAPRRRLGEILVAGGAISEHQLARALSEQAATRLPLGQTLLTLGFVTDEVMRRALGSQLGVPYIELSNVVVDRALARSIDPGYALEHLVVPIAQVGSMLTVAMDDPTATGVVDELERLTGSTVSVVTSSAQSIRHTLKRLYDEPLPGEGGRAPARSDVAEFLRRRLDPSARHASVALLGLGVTSFDALRQTAQAGLPVSALERFAGNSGVAEAWLLEHLRVTPDAFAARRRQGRLTADESDRLLALAHVYGLAIGLFNGDAALATAWMQSRQPSLEGAVPLEVARTALGAREVEATIARLQGFARR
jgi:putative toxin-antitoxin system antitoxin component (TIGR02293 family)